MQIDVVAAQLPRRLAVAVFLSFALAYFFSAVIRAATATLAPTLTQAFALSPGDLGLLSGGYFLGFAAMQLPLGKWLDAHGPKKVIMAFLAVAVVGCLAFAAAQGFWTLWIARVLCGVGVSACLMAPLAGYRRWFAAEHQLRANSWMLMSGSLGMVASTLPIAWLLPVMGWRGIFVLIAVLIAGVMINLVWRVPEWSSSGAPVGNVSYGQVFKHPYFIALAPMAFFNYGGMIAIQALWAGPWLQQVTGLNMGQAAAGLFGINVCMLFAFLVWGWANPHLSKANWGANRLMRWGMPLSLVALAFVVSQGVAGHWWMWAAYCVLTTFVALGQPALALVFDARIAGRALTAYNLMIFAGVFAVQWGIGLGVDALKAQGFSLVAAYQGAVWGFGGMCLASYMWFVWCERDNLRP